MFAPHTAQITIARAEPAAGLDLEKAASAIRERNESLAEQCFVKLTLKTRPKNKATAYERIVKAWEFDERLKPLQAFVEAWNRWRIFYNNGEENRYYGDWEPKSLGQITMIETVLNTIEQHDLDLDYYIACGHKAYQRSRYPLTLNQLVAHGLDFFSRYLEDVKVDIDEEEYKITASSSDRWEAEADD